MDIHLAHGSPIVDAQNLRMLSISGYHSKGQFPSPSNN